MRKTEVGIVIAINQLKPVSCIRKSNAVPKQESGKDENTDANLCACSMPFENAAGL